MSLYEWQSVDGDGQNVASWGGTVPGTGDTGLFTGLSNVNLATGLTFSGTPVFVTYPQYRGNVGSPGNPIITNAQGGRFIHRGTGTFYMGTMQMTSGGDMVIDTPLAGDIAAEINNIVGIANVYVKSGRVVINSGAQVTSILEVFGENSRVVLERDDAKLPPLNIFVMGGVLEHRRTGASTGEQITVSGGIVDITGVLRDGTEVDITGGVVRYHPDDDPSGQTVGAKFMVNGGVLDISESTFAIPADVRVGPRGRVIGNAVDTASSWIDIDLRQNYP